MVELTKKYLDEELEKTQRGLKEAETMLDTQNTWVSKGERVIDAYYKKCDALKKIIISPIVILTSFVVSSTAIIGLKEIVPSIISYIGIEGLNVIVSAASAIVFVKNLDEHKYQTKVIEESHRYAPCEFHKLPNGELSAVCHLEKDKEAKIRLEGIVQEYRNYIRGIERIYDKITEEEALEKEAQIKKEEFGEKLLAEWEAYLEETSKFNLSTFHYKNNLYDIEPVQLKKQNKKGE